MATSQGDIFNGINQPKNNQPNLQKLSWIVWKQPHKTVSNCCLKILLICTWLQNEKKPYGQGHPMTCSFLSKCFVGPRVFKALQMNYKLTYKIFRVIRSFQRSLGLLYTNSKNLMCALYWRFTVGFLCWRFLVAEYFKCFFFGDKSRAIFRRL